jgi:hypothetical protein
VVEVYVYIEGYGVEFLPMEILSEGDEAIIDWLQSFASGD